MKKYLNHKGNFQGNAPPESPRQKKSKTARRYGQSFATYRQSMDAVDGRFTFCNQP